MTEEEKKALYNKNPAWFKQRIEEKFSKYKSTVGIAGLRGRRTLANIGESNRITEERVQDIVDDVARFVVSIADQAPEPTPEEVVKNRSASGQKVKYTPEIFAEVKEQHDRGESSGEIVAIVQRKFQITMPKGIVNDFVKADSVEDYYEQRRQVMREYLQNQKKKVNAYEESVGARNFSTPPKIASAKDRYARLTQFREGLDEVLISFIIEEVEENYRELQKENGHLRSENEKLHQKLVALEQPNFMKSLKEKLEEKRQPLQLEAPKTEVTKGGE